MCGGRDLPSAVTVPNTWPARVSVMGASTMFFLLVSFKFHEWQISDTSCGFEDLPMGGSAAWAATEATRAATPRTLRTLLISKGIVFLISGSWKKRSRWYFA